VVKTEKQETKVTFNKKRKKRSCLCCRRTQQPIIQLHTKYDPIVFLIDIFFVCLFAPIFLFCGCCVFFFSLVCELNNLTKKKKERRVNYLFPQRLIGSIFCCLDVNVYVDMLYEGETVWV
jgi:hypothetical protein